MGIVKTSSKIVIVRCGSRFIQKSKIKKCVENDSLSGYNRVLPVWLGLQKFFQAGIQASCHEKIKVNILLVFNSK